MKHKLVILSILIISIANSAWSQKYAKWFAESEMKRFPQAWQVDFASRPFFGYSQGVVGCSMLQLWKSTGDKKYFDYVEKWVDQLINDKGEISLYDQEAYNIDFLNSGKVLFDVYKQTGNPKYKLAMDCLIAQTKNHPRTKEGAFWHKKIYTHQIWLDGLYMGATFIAQYGATFDKPELVNDAVNQFIICDRHNYDKKTGLYYHGWDESKEQLWANKETGQSPNFWGRSMGWWFIWLWLTRWIMCRPTILNVLNLSGWLTD